MNHKIIFENNIKINYSKNPISYLFKKGEIVELSKNLYQFNGSFLKNFRSLDRFFFNLAVKKFGANDQENPILWPLELYEKVNYFSNFPQQVMLTTGLKKNNHLIKKFLTNYKKNKKLKKIKFEKFFNHFAYGLQSSVCNHCYYALKNRKNIKNKVVTTSGKVFRDEQSKYMSIDRLKCFTVRDVVFIGTENFVEKKMKIILDQMKNILKKINLNCSIELANDPFFDDSKIKKKYQNTFNSKYEIKCTIPYLKKKIAIGSFNFHKTSFGNFFNIGSEKKYFHSACFGIGFERLLLALYSQNGVDIKKWNRQIKNFLKIKI